MDGAVHEEMPRDALPDARLRTANRRLAWRSAIDRARLTATDERTFLQDACQSATALGGHQRAWVGLVMPEQGLVRTVAEAGVEPSRPAGSATAGIDFSVGEDAFRLRVEGEQGTTFDDDELVALREIAADLAAGIGSMRDRKAKAHVDAEFRRVFEQVAEVLFTLAVEPGPIYRFTSANPAFEVATGVPVQALIGKRIDEVIPEPSLSLVLSKYAEAIATQRIVSWREVTVYPKGRKVGDVTMRPVFAPDGTCTHLVGVVHDVTDMVAAEDELRRLNAELDGRIQERTRELEAAVKELEAFSYTVSHDLRAPLRAINGFSQALLSDHHEELDDEGRDLLERVRAGSQRMGSLIDDILGLSRVSRAPLRRERVDVSAMATEMLAELQQQEPHRVVAVRVEAGLVAAGDAALLRVLLQNLIDNAWKFTSKHPAATIEVGAKATPDGQAFFVRDDGAGFDPRYADKLFGAFERLHSRAEFPGNGIGLATVRRIAGRHGGKAWAEGEVQKGATFYFTLAQGAPE